MTEQQHVTTHQHIKESDDDSTNRIGPHDVLLGRGGAANNHLGNRLFRSIVLQHQVEYLQCRKLDKSKVAKKIVAIIQGEGGRFLQRTVNADSWEEVSAKKAQEKTSQALREGLDVRHSQIRLPKSATMCCSSNSSVSKTRKPYTIKQPITAGKVQTKDENKSEENKPSSTISDHPSPIKSVEEYAAMAIASLVSSSSR